MATLGSITLNVSDFNRATQFYDQLLFMMSFEVDYQSENCKVYWSHQQQLVLQAGETPDKKGTVEIGLQVGRRVEVQQLYKLLQELEVPIHQKLDRYESCGLPAYAFSFTDPDGYRVRIFVPVRS
jgi:catechol-2,3-dioxygenase